MSDIDFLKLKIMNTMRIVGYLNISEFFPSSVAVVVTDSEKKFLMFPGPLREDFDEHHPLFHKIETNFYKASAGNLFYEEDKVYFMFSPERIVCESRQKLFILLREELGRDKNKHNKEILIQYMENYRLKSS